MKEIREIMIMRQRKYIAENDEEILTGDKNLVKRDQIDRVKNKKYDEIYQIQKKQANKINL